MTEHKELNKIEGKIVPSRLVEKFKQELRVKTALEKQIAKKPLHDGCYDKNGKWHEWNGINGKPYELCPNCRENLCCEMPNEKKPNFCDNCGQRLDWSDENETY